MLLHRSDLKISEKFRHFFRIFWQILQQFFVFEFFSLIFAHMLMKFCRNFADILENVEFFTREASMKSEKREIFRNF